MSRISTLQELAGFAALAVALVVCVWAEPIGKYLAVIDAPDGARKHHEQPTPLVGGIAIVLSLAIWASATLLWGDEPNAPLLTAVLLCGTGVALVGFTDDQSSTLPLGRVGSVIVLTLAAFAIDKDLLARPVLFWGSFPPTHLQQWAMAILLCVSMVGFVNAVNMADGQNGIVAGIFAIWSLCLIFVGSGTVKDVAQVLLASSVLVLAFNLSGRLFLGDCGTYGVSFVFGLLAIRAHAKGLISVETIVVWFFLPVMDCLRLTIMRPVRGVSPANAGRDHFHHRLQDKLGRHLGLVTYLGIVAASSLVACLDPRFDLVCLIVLSAIYFSFSWVTLGPALDEADPLSLDGVHDNVISISEGESARKTAK